MSNLEKRIEDLERQDPDNSELLVLWGDEPMPERIGENVRVILRYDGHRPEGVDDESDEQ